MSVEVNTKASGNPVIDHLGLWSSVYVKKATTGSGSNGKISAYGIQKLRELILELAVRGKLISQDPNDVPARVILGKVAEEKVRLVKEGKFKRQKQLLGITDDEKPFELPIGWEWEKLGKVAEVIRGVTYKKHDVREAEFEESISLMRANNIGYTLNHEGLIYVPNKYVREDQVLSVGDLLIAMSSGSANLVGKAAQFNSDIHATFGAFCGVVRAVSSEFWDYLGFFFKTPLYRGQTSKAGKGIGINNLNKGSLENLLVAVPPLAEQHRIVTKVDELMALCDQLEQQQTDSLQAHQTLVETLLRTLVEATDSQSTQQTWGRIADHFDTLFTTEESINQLKQTILQLAVMGKLVPQDPNNEPASVLLEKIAEEKARLLKEGKINKQKPLPKLYEEELLFQVPEGWIWTNLSNVFQELKYGTSKRCGYEMIGDPVLRIPNVVSGYIDSTDLKFTVLNDKERKRLGLKEGDLLIIRSNGSSSIVGRSAVVGSLHIGYAYAGYLVRVRFNNEFCNPLFLKLVLDSRLIRDQIELPIRTTSGVKNINSTEIGGLIMPLAPLAEQHRIVARVDELMAVCDSLKARIQDAITTQVHLADAVVERAVS